MGQLKQSVKILYCPSRSLLMLSNVTKSPVLSAQSLSQSFPKKSVSTNTLRNTKRLSPKLLLSTTLKKPMSKWSLSAVVDTMPLCTMPQSTTPLFTTPPTMGSITPPTMGSVTMEPTLDTPHTREYSLPHTLLARGRPRLRPAQRLKLMLQDQNVMLKDMVMPHPDTAKRFVLTNPFLFPWSHVLISLSPNASKYLLFK